MGYWIPPILFVLFIVMCMCAGGDRQADDAEDCSIDTHRMNGMYRVLYDDGFLSQPFMDKTATFYASHFGGKVVPRSYDQYGPHRVLPGGRWVNVPKNAPVN
jgi:hypothetical protein